MNDDHLSCFLLSDLFIFFFYLLHHLQLNVSSMDTNACDLSKVFDVSILKFVLMRLKRGPFNFLYKQKMVET